MTTQIEVLCSHAGRYPRPYRVRLFELTERPAWQGPRWEAVKAVAWGGGPIDRDTGRRSLYDASSAVRTVRRARTKTGQIRELRVGSSWVVLDAEPEGPPPTSLDELPAMDIAHLLFCARPACQRELVIKGSKLDPLLDALAAHDLDTIELADLERAAVA